MSTGSSVAQRVRDDLERARNEFWARQRQIIEEKRQRRAMAADRKVAR